MDKAIMDELLLARKVCSAADDVISGKKDKRFQRMCGGQRRLDHGLEKAVECYQKYVAGAE